jgi:hypothetical protein
VANPFNPLDWLKSTQDWFARSERSSGFRPFLIFMLITFGLSLALLAAFGDRDDVRQVALILPLGVAASFVILFAIKSLQDPDFCRSETHIRQMKKLELMGSESEALPGEVVEAETAIDAPPPPKQIPERSSEQA